MYFVPMIVWLCCLILAIVNVGRGIMMPDQVKAYYNIVRWVLQNDSDWKDIIQTSVTGVDTTKVSRPVASMLLELGFDDSKTLKGQPILKAQPILRYLDTNLGSTGSQLFFGMKVLGVAISCQFINTIAVHLYFISMIAMRKGVNVSPIRSYLSLIHVTMAKYMDKLAVLAEPVNHFMHLSTQMNVLFSKHQENENVEKKVFIDGIIEIRKFIKLIQIKKCASVTDEAKLSKTIQSNNTNKNVFKTSNQRVDDLQLIAMIEAINQYEFIDFSSMGVNFWTRRLAIQEYIHVVENQWAGGKEEANDDISL